MTTAYNYLVLSMNKKYPVLRNSHILIFYPQKNPLHWGIILSPFLKCRKCDRDNK